MNEQPKTMCQAPTASEQPAEGLNPKITCSSEFLEQEERDEHAFVGLCIL